MNTSMNSYSSDNATAGIWRAMIVEDLGDGTARVYIPSIHVGMNPFKAKVVTTKDENGEEKTEVEVTTELNEEHAVPPPPPENEDQLSESGSTNTAASSNEPKDTWGNSSESAEHVSFMIASAEEDTSDDKETEEDNKEETEEGADSKDKSSEYEEKVKATAEARSRFPVAPICAWQVRSKLKEGDPVWVMLENGNIQYPIIIGQFGKLLPEGVVGGTSSGSGFSPTNSAALSGDVKYIWDFFLDKVQNEYGVAGLMGNLRAESALCPYRVQGDYSSGYTDSKAYTDKVDSGEISGPDFYNGGPGGGGYGLAQWTSSNRKKGLYDSYMNNKSTYSSIGCIQLACDWLWHELQTDYTKTLNTLKSCSSIREASDMVLHDFERPEDQSVAVEEARAAMGQEIYDQVKSGAFNGGKYAGDVAAWAAAHPQGSAAFDTTSATGTQCTELIVAYMRDVLGINYTQTGNGNQVASTLASALPDKFDYFGPGTSPTAGDIISINPNDSFGHVGIITASDGQTVTFMDQWDKVNPRTGASRAGSYINYTKYSMSSITAKVAGIARPK